MGLFLDDSRTQIQTKFWFEPGFEDDSYGELTYEHFPDIVKTVSRGGALVFEDLDALDDLSDELARVREHQIRSFLVCPIILEGDFVGGITLARRDKPMDLSDQDLADLGVVATLLADVVARHRAWKLIRQRDAELLHSRKMEAVGLLAGGIAHDFNNLLMVIQGFATDLLSNDHLDASARQDLSDILQASTRGAELTSQLLAFGRRQHLSTRAFSLNGLLEDLEGLLSRTAGRACLAGDSARAKPEESSCGPRSDRAGAPQSGAQCM